MKETIKYGIESFYHLLEAWRITKGYELADKIEYCYDKNNRQIREIVNALRMNDITIYWNRITVEWSIK